MKRLKKLAFLLAFGVAAGIPTTAAADTIDPTSYAATLAVGESVTIRKTVVVQAGSPTGALLDVVFVIDTSGSMGGAIANAKTAASGILAGLDAFGDLASGSGYYSEPGSDGLYRPLTTNAATQQQNINDINLGLGGGGGDFPEEGFNAVKQAADGTAWRAGSNRFVIALGDATFKESDGATQANTIAALNAVNATFIGIDFANLTNVGFGGISPQAMATATGGSILSGGSTPAALTAAILAGISSAFADYDTVTVGDLNAGAPGVDVTAVCISAGIGTCAGATATGDYDRSIDRTFLFDVTFTGLAEGTWSFPTRAIVDGGIVATESDRITVGEGGPTVPEPMTLALFGLGIAGLAARRRRVA